MVTGSGHSLKALCLFGRAQLNCNLPTLPFWCRRRKLTIQQNQKQKYRQWSWFDCIIWQGATAIFQLCANPPQPSPYWWRRRTTKTQQGTKNKNVTNSVTKSTELPFLMQMRVSPVGIRCPLPGH